MKKIYEFKTDEKKYMMVNMNPNERKEAFEINKKEMQFDTNKFYQYVFADIEPEISSLIKYIAERSQGFSTYMSVIGTGGADAGSVNDIVVYIVNIIELFKDEIDCDIHIIVSDKEEKLGLMNLKML